MSQPANAPTTGRVSGKVALVTGAAQGIGAACARLLAREGALVFVADILEGQGRQVAAEISAQGGQARFLRLNVAQERQWQAALVVIEAEFGRLDILVNNAGVGQQLPIEDTPVEVWDATMAVNATGMFLGVKYVAPLLRRARGGSIINISSLAGLVGGGASAPYHASKGAARFLTKHAAIALARDNIRVNSVHPGVIETPLTAEFLAFSANRANREAKTPLGRIGTPEDVAWGVLFLASADSSFMTGAELVIDGGRFAQ